MLKVAGVHVGHRPGCVVSGVVDGDIQAALSGAHLLEQRLQVGFAGGVGHDRSSGSTC